MAGFAEGLIRAYEGGEAQRVDSDRRSVLSAYGAAAQSGDKSAIDKISGVAPDIGLKYAEYASKLGERERAKSSEDWEWIGQALVRPDGSPIGAEDLPRVQMLAKARGIDPKVVDSVTPEQIPSLIQTSKAAQEYSLKAKGARSFEQDMQLKRAGAPVTNINMPRQVTKFEEKYGEQLATDYSDMQKSGRAAIEQQAKVKRLGQMLEKTYTGAGGETVQNLKSLASSMGFNVEGVAEGDAARAISNELALQIRNPDLGPGMPGALSERDITFLVSINPGLTLVPGGNKMLVDYWTRINQRKQDIAALARQYRVANNGVFDEGFNQVVAKFANENPLFSEVDMQDLSGALARSPGKSPVTNKTLRFNEKTGQVE